MLVVITAFVIIVVCFVPAVVIATVISVIAIVGGLYTDRPRPFESRAGQRGVACLCACSCTLDES